MAIKLLSYPLTKIGFHSSSSVMPYKGVKGYLSATLGRPSLKPLPLSTAGSWR